MAHRRLGGATTIMLPSTPVNPSAPALELNAQASADEGDGSAAPTRAEIEAMHERFRSVKHSACNALAVMMALSEMAQRNPAYVEKLTSTVLTKSPQMVTELRQFDDELRALLGGKPE